MLKYSDEKLKFDYKGNVYELTYPTSLQKKKWETNCYKIGIGELDKNFYDYHKEFMVELGMEAELYDELQWKHLEEITQYLNGQKKS